MSVTYKRREADIVAVDVIIVIVIDAVIVDIPGGDGTWRRGESAS